MKSIVAAFLRRAFGEAPVAPAAQQASASSSDIVQYDDRGAAIDVAKLVLVNKGYEVGTTYTSSKLGPHNAWKLISIDGDGTSKLQPYSNIG